jgi:hypothetical protein
MDIVVGSPPIRIGPAEPILKPLGLSQRTKREAPTDGANVSVAPLRKPRAMYVEKTKGA